MLITLGYCRDVYMNCLQLVQSTESHDSEVSTICEYCSVTGEWRRRKKRIGHFYLARPWLLPPCNGVEHDLVKHAKRGNLSEISAVLYSC